MSSSRYYVATTLLGVLSFAAAFVVHDTYTLPKDCDKGVLRTSDIENNPETVTRSYMSNVTFKCPTCGNSTHRHVVWKHRGTLPPAKYSSRFVFNDTAFQLQIYNLTRAVDDGDYYCIVTDEYNSTARNHYILFVDRDHSNDHKFELLKKGLQDVVLPKGANHTFRCKSDYPDDEIGVVWFKQGIQENEREEIDDATDLEFKIFNATTADEGFYTCSISLASGTIKSKESTAKLSIKSNKSTNLS